MSVEDLKVQIYKDLKTINIYKFQMKIEINLFFQRKLYKLLIKRTEN